MPPAPGKTPAPQPKQDHPPRDNSRPAWAVRGARAKVPVKNKRGQVEIKGAEIADLYPGGATVFIDRTPGLPVAYLYSELEQDEDEAKRDRLFGRGA